MDDSISVKSPAKINISLDILGQKNDGYHFLRSIMQSISIYDKLTITKNNEGKIEISCDNDTIPCDESNLAYKGAISFFNYAKITDIGIDIKIEKGIPALAGLAGGSADAAGAIVALNELYDTDFSMEELCDIGEKVGADVPFCIKGSTALAEGVGDILSPLPSFPECYFVVVKPNFDISTPEAFKKYDTLHNAKSSEFDDLVAALAVGDLKEISTYLFNALEYASQNEDIKKIKSQLVEEGALGALMTGSGSAVYGIFEKKKQAISCADELVDLYPFVKVCKPVTHGSIVV